MTSIKKPALGRGLSALIPSSRPHLLASPSALFPAGKSVSISVHPWLKSLGCAFAPLRSLLSAVKSALLRRLRLLRAFQARPQTGHAHNDGANGEY